MSEHLEEVNPDAFAEGAPSFGGSFSMSDSIHIFPRSMSHLSLDDFFPWLPGFVGEVTRAKDMTQGCSQGYKPKTGPKWTQKENIPKQRKYIYFTALKF